MPQPSFVKIVGGFPVIDIGSLRHAITIQSQGPASPPAYNESGQIVQWNAFTTAIAAIDTIRGTDVIRSGQVTTQLFLTVATWWQPGILPNMRVLNDNGGTYLIQSVENILEINSVLILNCIGLGANE